MIRAMQDNKIFFIVIWSSKNSITIKSCNQIYKLADRYWQSVVKLLIHIYIMNEAYIIINYSVDLSGDLFIRSKLSYSNFIDSWEA